MTTARTRVALLLATAVVVVADVRMSVSSSGPASFSSSLPFPLFFYSFFLFFLILFFLFFYSFFPLFVPFSVSVSCATSYSEKIHFFLIVLLSKRTFASLKFDATLVLFTPLQECYPILYNL